jgi:hypothetical protein
MGSAQYFESHACILQRGLHGLFLLTIIISASRARSVVAMIYEAVSTKL